MILTHFDLENKIDFHLSRFYSLNFEDVNYMFKLVKELNAMVGGDSGEFALTDNLKNFKIADSVYVFSDYFNIDFNSKQIVNTIIKKLQSVSTDSDKQYKFNSIKNVIKDYVDDLLFDIDLPIVYDEIAEDMLIKSLKY
ncbi:MAG: type II-A CRISPR-associated protein Csn2 [Clostridia bacterium]|nr:type II-A CRISPR-associated protein Csn2 [Clostridia bacterium]